MIDGQTIDGQVTDDGKTLVAQLLLKDTTTYTIHLFTAGGHTDPQPRVNQVKVVTDAPPTVQLVEPARETTIAVGAKPKVVEKGKDAKAGNRIIRFTMNEDVAGSTGVLYYSNFFPVEEGATYRFQCRWRTTGLAAKVFIKCYDELPTSFRTMRGRRFAQDREARGLPQPAKPAGICRSLECADRGFHAPAHPVYPPLGTSGALCLLAGRIGRVG